jgi:hypothetical protein
MSINFNEELKTKINIKYSNKTTAKLYMNRLNSICKKANINDIDDIKNNVDNLIYEVGKLSESTQYIYLMTIKTYLSFYEIENETLNKEIDKANTIRKTIDNNRHKNKTLNETFSIDDIRKFSQDQYKRLNN